MHDPTRPDDVIVSVGGSTRTELIEALSTSGVHLNAAASTLLDDAVFDDVPTETVRVVERSVGALGLTGGATLPEILSAAQHRGLGLCPPVTGPYLRLSMRTQATAPDSVMSSGHAPAGSVTVASAPLRDDDEYPKGFYLRVIDGVPWLRGYHCTPRHVWHPGDLFAFRLTSD